MQPTPKTARLISGMAWGGEIGDTSILKND
jgi:hypothetical protein